MILMKTLTLILMSLLSITCNAQLIKDEAREDGTHEYWFTLDEFSAPVQFPIRVEQLDGTSVKLTGETALKGKSGILIVKDLKLNRIDTIQLTEVGKFEYACSKLIRLTVEIDGFVPYEKESQKLDGLSMLVVKLHPIPEDVIYLLITKSVITDKALQTYMKCLFTTQKTGSDKTCTLPEFVRLETR